MINGGRPLIPEIWVKLPRWSEIADFRFIFARIASVVTPGEKGQLTQKGRTKSSAFQRAQDEHLMLSLSPQRVAQKRSVHNSNNKLR